MHQTFDYTEIPKHHAPTLTCEGKNLHYNSDFLINRSTGELVITQIGQIKIRNAIKEKYKLSDNDMPKDEKEAIERDISVDTEFTSEHYTNVQARLW